MGVFYFFIVIKWVKKKKVVDKVLVVWKDTKIDLLMDSFGFWELFLDVEKNIIKQGDFITFKGAYVISHQPISAHWSKAFSHTKKD